MTRSPSPEFGDGGGLLFLFCFLCAAFLFSFVSSCAIGWEVIGLKLSRNSWAFKAQLITIYKAVSRIVSQSMGPSPCVDPPMFKSVPNFSKHKELERAFGG